MLREVSSRRNRQRKNPSIKGEGEGGIGGTGGRGGAERSGEGGGGEEERSGGGDLLDDDLACRHCLGLKCIEHLRQLLAF